MGKKSGYHSPGMLVVLPKGCMPGTPKSNIQPTQPTHGSEKQIHHIYNPRPTTQVELEMHHDHDYSDSTTPSTAWRTAIFARMYDFGRMYAGPSLAGARKLRSRTCDTAINCSGDLHHAKRGEASGSCYVNDIAPAILELLRPAYHPRGLYINIDIHHRTVSSLHSSTQKGHESFSPEQEHSMINGANLGKHFCLNVPLQDGIDDETYLTVFETVIEATVAAFRPTAIVLQRSAASLGCDRLGAFNFSIAAHGKCVNFVRRFNVPLRAPSRGAGRTRLLFSLAQKYRTNCPPVYDPFLRHSQWKFHPLLTGRVKNQNAPASLQKITISIQNKLRYLQGAPSAAMQSLLANEDQNREERDEERGTGRAAATGVPPSMSTSKVIRRRPRPLSGPKRNSISPSVRKPRSKRTRGRGRGRASRTHGREDGKEVDEPGGPSSAKPGKTRGRTRSHVKPRCRVAEKVKDMGDVDADVGGEPESGFEPATPVDIGIDM
ncbi:hypothetical protein EV401DRAFT_2062182 [Pisolithus croceorrhizus]|nr:hypothetical protein EV401DRAFT_2062182 [Pisolithus croceorrhizus]